MPDREKVISEFEKWCDAMEDECPVICLDALALLKEQKPVEAEIEGGGSSWWYVCGECHGAIDKWDSFCKHCGRPVKKGVK